MTNMPPPKSLSILGGSPYKNPWANRKIFTLQTKLSKKKIQSLLRLILLGLYSPPLDRSIPPRTADVAAAAAVAVAVVAAAAAAAAAAAVAVVAVAEAAAAAADAALDSGLVR